MEEITRNVIAFFSTATIAETRRRLTGLCCALRQLRYRVLAEYASGERASIVEDGRDDNRDPLGIRRALAISQVADACQRHPLRRPDWDCYPAEPVKKGSWRFSMQSLPPGRTCGRLVIASRRRVGALLFAWAHALPPQPPDTAANALSPWPNCETIWQFYAMRTIVRAGKLRADGSQLGHASRALGAPQRTEHASNVGTSPILNRWITGTGCWIPSTHRSRHEGPTINDE